MRHRFALAALVGIVVAGCGGGGQQSSATIVGTWTLDSMRAGNSEVACPGQVTVQSSTFSCARDQLVFKSDFSVVRHPADGSDDVSGAWTINGTTLTMQMGQTVEEADIAFSPSGDSFSASSTVNGQNLTFNWIRG